MADAHIKGVAETYSVLTTGGPVILGVTNEAGSELVTADGVFSPLACDKQGRLYVNLVEGSGAALGLVDSDDARINPSVAYPEDSATAAGHYLTPPGAVVNTNSAVFSATEGDYVPIAADSHGHLAVCGAELGGATASYVHGLLINGGVVLDARPATDVVAGNGQYSMFQMTQYGEMRVRDDDANTDLAAIEVATKNRDEVLSRTDRLTVTTSSTLAALSSALPATTTSIALIPELSTDDIRMNIGTASATTPKVATTGEVIPITKAVGDTVELFAVGGGPLYVSLRVYVSRVP